jgi:hypothetical protein
MTWRTAKEEEWFDRAICKGNEERLSKSGWRREVPNKESIKEDNDGSTVTELKRGKAQEEEEIGNIRKMEIDNLSVQGRSKRILNGVEECQDEK